MTGEFDPVPARMPTPPKRPLPPGACDTHTHVFGPFDRFAVPVPSSYAPPIAPPEVHQDMLDRAGFDRAVIIQPAPYGTDNGALLSALRGRPHVLRGVAVLAADVTEDQMHVLHAAGVRGLRFSEMKDPRSGGRYKGSIGIDDYIRLAPRMREFGWIPHVWAKCADLAEFLPTVLESGLPFVVDHLAAIDTASGVDDPAFRSVLRHLSEGRIWVKLSLCRNSTRAPGYEDERPFHDALIRANPDRLLWGSDWPFVRMYEKSPDVGQLVDVFDAWVGDDDLRTKILVTNPAGLYGFGDVAAGAAGATRAGEGAK
ncbi:amidohydrolase family protein [Pseudochelatococcus sp. B33]